METDHLRTQNPPRYGKFHIIFPIIFDRVPKDGYTTYIDIKNKVIKHKSLSQLLSKIFYCGFKVSHIDPSLADDKK